MREGERGEGGEENEEPAHLVWCGAHPEEVGVRKGRQTGGEAARCDNKALLGNASTYIM